MSLLGSEKTGTLEEDNLTATISDLIIFAKFVLSELVFEFGEQDNSLIEVLNTIVNTASFT